MRLGGRRSAIRSEAMVGCTCPTNGVYSEDSGYEDSALTGPNILDQGNQLIASVS